jgi:hypothetical protein
VYEKMLEDKATGYHKYFAIVYQLEKIRVISLHLRLLKVIMRVIGLLREGKSLK